jgi:phage FluMu protein Com
MVDPITQAIELLKKHGELSLRYFKCTKCGYQRVTQDGHHIQVCPKCKEDAKRKQEEEREKVRGQQRKILEYLLSPLRKVDFGFDDDRDENWWGVEYNSKDGTDIKFDVCFKNGCITFSGEAEDGQGESHELKEISFYLADPKVDLIVCDWILEQIQNLGVISAFQNMVSDTSLGDINFDEDSKWILSHGGSKRWFKDIMALRKTLQKQKKKGTKLEGKH